MRTLISGESSPWKLWNPLIGDPTHPYLHGPVSSSLLTSYITSLSYKGTRCVDEGPPIGPHLNHLCLPGSCGQSRFPSEVLGVGIQHHFV